MLLVSLIPVWKPGDVMQACLKRAMEELAPEGLLLVADGTEAEAVSNELALRVGVGLDTVVVTATPLPLEDNAHFSRRVAQLREVARSEAVSRGASSVFWLDCDTLAPVGLGERLSELRGRQDAPCYVTTYPDRKAGYLLPPMPLPPKAGAVPAGKVCGMGLCWMDVSLLASQDFEGYLDSDGWFPSYGEDDWFMRPLQEQGLVYTTGLKGAHYEQRAHVWRVHREGGIWPLAGRQWPEGRVPLRLAETAGGLLPYGQGAWGPGDTCEVCAEVAAALLGNEDFELAADSLPELILPEGV